MVSINIINNFYIIRRTLRSIGRTGNRSRVFFEQGELEGACAVYSLMMMLVIHQKKCLRLFCLDPSWGLDYASYWNNIIDINTDNDDVERIDYEYMSDRNIKVTGILLINEDADVINSSLPF